MASANTAESLRDTLSAETAAIRAEFEDSHHGRTVLQRNSALLDSLHSKLWDTYLADSQGLALVAIGGYGRGAMYPCSDVDLMFLHSGESIGAELKDKIRQFSQDLWDMRLKLSPMTRSLKECETLHRNNLEFNISLLDCRFLQGDYDLFRRMHDHAIPKVLLRDWREIVTDLSEMHALRRRKYSDTIFHLEPNVKEAPGGLRDYHLACWLAKLNGFERSRMWVNVAEQFPASLREGALEALDFISTVRCFLHYRAGRDDNSLSWEAQEAAAAIGLGTHAGISTEDWMRTYFRHARLLFRLASLMLDEVLPQRSSVSSQFNHWRTKVSNAEFSVVNGRAVVLQPSAMLSTEVFYGLFSFTADLGVRLSGTTEHKVQEVLPSIAARALGGPQRWEILSSVLRGKHAGAAMRSMHELGVLGLLLPEFRNVECLVIRDYYHRYTVDEHIFRAVDVIDSFARDDKERRQSSETFVELMREIACPELLKLSLLLHDLGKAEEGENHLESGMTIAAKVCSEFGLSDSDTDRVCFLVAYHVEMSQAMRRDIFNPETVNTLAQKVGVPEYLKLLTLMTFADISAVNPEAMTRWKSENLWNLYIATSNHLNRSIDDDRYASDEAQSAAVRLLAPKLGNRLKEFLSGMPRRYLRLHSAIELQEHVEMASKLKTEPVKVSLKREPGTMRMTVVTQDRPVLFASLTGALAGWGMNIVKADAFSNGNGVVVDSFVFTDRFRTLEMNLPEWDRFKASIADVLLGRVSLESLMSGRKTVKKARPKVKIESKVTFDDGASTHSTVVEIVAQDRPGVLHEISSELASFGCNIEVALIDTEGEMAIDVFYLTMDGKKIDPNEERRLEERLLARLR
jgi:[protein-PII] uridylyltransferase